ncbi:immunoglobulin-like domain-containing protein [Hahella ganghwensis]|uniref:pectate lyase family protein n=1 Tax=Hahella ganghwensis TaxID=286420 RepID=UPI000399AC94|nr:immunoglobulin-like domain-containing protein [Hahella ganghwensis]
MKSTLTALLSINLMLITSACGSNDSSLGNLDKGNQTDKKAPTLTINSPTPADNYNSDFASVILGGTARDNKGVNEVNWRCSTGCSGSGSATGTTDWHTGEINLADGENTIIVTAHDAAGNTGDDIIVVSYLPLPNAAPVITLIGDPLKTLYIGDVYNEPGATGMDAEDGDISHWITINNDSVDTTQAGSYQVTYNLTDSDGNEADTVIRTVEVRETSSGGQDVVSETSECYDRIVTGGQSCAADSIRCVGAGQEYDTNNGLKSAFDSALDNMQPGDAMCIRGGVYTYSGSGALIDIDASKNCSADSGRCFIASYPNELAILHGAGSESSFQNLVIKGGNEPDDSRGQYAAFVVGDHWDIGFLEMRYFIGDSSFAGVLLAGDHLRLHHNHIHNIWSDLIRNRAMVGSDDSGVGAGHPLVDSDEPDASDILIDKNYLHHSRAGIGISIYPTGSGDLSQIFNITMAYNVLHSSGWRPDGTFQPCSSSASNCVTGNFGELGSSVWGNSDSITLQKNCHIGDPVTKVRCWDITIKHNIVFKAADDCIDTTVGRMTLMSNIAWYCGPAARRGLKDFLPGSGPRRNFGNLALGTSPMMRGDWNEPNMPFFYQGTEWRVSGDNEFLVYNNSLAFWGRSGIDLLVQSNMAPSTFDSLKVKNNLGFGSPENFRYNGNISNRDESNNFSGIGGSEQVALGTSDFTGTDISLDWTQNATNEEIHRHLWLQFYNKFKPAAGSPLINAGIAIDGVHCTNPDPVYPYPLSTGYDDSCLHWTGSAPDIGAFESSGNGSGDGDSGSERPWEDITDRIIGFGKNVTGGKGAPLCHVTTLAASGAGSLRACAEQSAAAWIVFDVSGTISLDEAIDVQSNKTIDGRGADITLTGDGLLLDEGVENIIVHNIRIINSLTDKERDAITIYGDVKGVWIDHCTFSNFTDGLIDITVRSTDITLSWNHFYDHGKAVLISASDNDSFDDIIRVTQHHNFFDNITERSPRIRYGKVHAFNNYLRDWGYYGMRSAITAELFVENNIFEPGGSHNGVESLNNGYIRASGNLLNGTNIETVNPDAVFVPSDYYSYTAEIANEALKTKLLQQTGWQETPLPN